MQWYQFNATINIYDLEDTSQERTKRILDWVLGEGFHLAARFESLGLEVSTSIFDEYFTEQQEQMGDRQYVLHLEINKEKCTFRATIAFAKLLEGYAAVLQLMKPSWSVSLQFNNL